MNSLQTIDNDQPNTTFVQCDCTPDGNTIVIGRYSLDGSSSAGWQVYNRAEGTSRWLLQTTINLGIEGNSISMSNNGQYVIMGAPTSSSGNVYVNGLSNTLAIPSGKTYAGFGYSVAISGNGEKIVVGSPFAHSGTSVPGLQEGAVIVYKNTGGNTFIVEEDLSDIANVTTGLLGLSVSISNDGKTILAGAPLFSLGQNSKNVGGASLWNYNGSSWQLVYRFVLPLSDDPITSYQLQGSSVALSYDASKVAIGAINYKKTGAVFVFRKTQNWILEANPILIPITLADNLRYGIQLKFGKNSNNTLITSSPGLQIYTTTTGIADIFRYTDGIWSRSQNLNTQTTELANAYLFGLSVAVNENRTIGLVLASTKSYTGKLYIYTTASEGPVFCPYFEISGSNAYWENNTTAIGENGTGICDPRFYVQSGDSLPVATCQADGTWSSAIVAGNNCTMIPANENYCPAETYDGADWPSVLVTTTTVGATGVCDTPDYQSGSPTRNCLPGGTWDNSSLASPCVRECPAEIYDNTVWSSVAENVTDISSTTCRSGFIIPSGNATRKCTHNGWSTEVTNACIRNCIGDTYGGADWSTTDTQGLNSGNCSSGFILNPAGSPTRSCDVNNWNILVNNACISTATPPTCPSEISSNATWTTGIVGDTSTGFCIANNISNSPPTRECTASGWSEIDNPCQPNVCPPEEFDNAQWGVSEYGKIAIGVCKDNYEQVGGSVKRNCTVSGWNNTLASNSGTCRAISSCPSQIYMNSKWSRTDSGVTATGICKNGTNSVVKPTRLCQLDGIWSSLVANSCDDLNESLSVSAKVGIAFGVLFGAVLVFIVLYYLFLK